VEDLEVLEDHLVEDLEVFSVDLDHLHRDHHHQEEHGDQEAKEVILSNNGRTEEERLRDLRERRLEVEVSSIQKQQVMEVHLGRKILTVTNHQVMEQILEQVSLKELENMAGKDSVRRLWDSVSELDF